MGKGYVHPYHTKECPLFFSHMSQMKMLFEAVGPEQVSPHYESLTRSRRGLLFLYLYTATVISISRLGGWDHNEWLQAMIFHHEFIIGLFGCSIETRHFAFTPGPKFTVFYNTYIMYEYAQICSQWADNTEQLQLKHLVHTKQQMEYKRINDEFNFIKKRALVNFLVNSRKDLEQHFHGRAHNMLKAIEVFEGNNLKNLLSSISTAAIQKVDAALEDKAQREEILKASFESALIGIRTGKMEYVNDPILPILITEINARTAEFANLSAADESKLLSLNTD